MSNTYFTYILASNPHGTLYVGVTNNLEERLREHRSGEGSQFVKRYRVHSLVHYEEYADVCNAIDREKDIKNWKRKWKTELIEKHNPHWNDLSRDWC